MIKRRRFPAGDAIHIICENTDNYGNICGNGAMTIAMRDEFETNVPLTITLYCDRCKREIIVKLQDTDVITKSTNNLKYGYNDTRESNNSRNYLTANNVLPSFNK